MLFDPPLGGRLLK